MKEQDLKKLVKSVRQAGRIRRCLTRASRAYSFKPADIKSIQSRKRGVRLEFLFFGNRSAPCDTLCVMTCRASIATSGQHHVTQWGNHREKAFPYHGKKVMLDADLADLYGAEIRALNQAVSWNVERFPDDVMFQLTWDEIKELLGSQFVTLKRGQHLGDIMRK